LSLPIILSPFDSNQLLANYVYFLATESLSASWYWAAVHWLNAQDG
jgi:hypothetical protein